MNTKIFTVIGLKVIALTIILFFVFIIAVTISNITGTSSSTGELSQVSVGRTLFSVLLVSFLYTAIFTFIILRSHWNGWKLVGAVFLAFYGLMTVVTQIESIVYLQRQLPSDMIPKLFMSGAIMAGLFSPLAVLILGKMRRESMPPIQNLRLVMPLGEWTWKLVAIAAVYVVLYFTFGYFIAWKNPVVREYYGSTELDSFFTRIAYIWEMNSMLFLLQAFRAILWIAFVVPVIRMMKGNLWETGLCVALLYSILGSAQLLLPNPYMPEIVAKMHLVEIATSNFIFGWVVVWLLNKNYVSIRE